MRIGEKLPILKAFLAGGFTKKFKAQSTKSKTTLELYVICIKGFRLVRVMLICLAAVMVCCAQCYSNLIKSRMIIAARA